METKNKGFTLIEIVVVIGISIVLITVVSELMLSSFKVKNSTAVLETISTEASIALVKLKDNVFDASIDSFICPVGTGTSISFFTKGGGQTTLLCDVVTGKIASVSAESGSFSLTSNGVKASSCDKFVSCTTNSSNAVIDINFNLNIGLTDGQSIGQTWTFVNKVVVR
ncbi:MAG: prepilin-type N-terminal cleavage/methylation domain-containing protein [Candidatus Shapirobacteria bacterium]